jgi:hypothetical protein
MINTARASAALMLTAVFVVTSCSGTGSSSSAPISSKAATTPSSRSASQSTAPGRFASATYGYSVTPPVSWTSAQATSKWDGKTGLTIASPEVDKFENGSAEVVWGVATPWKGDLAAWTTFSIDWTNQFHGDSCTAEPAARTPITIGGQPGVLLAYDCGVLINIGATVHSGVGYWFTLKDEAVQAASDPTDHATFLRLLGSVQFPE